MKTTWIRLIFAKISSELADSARKTLVQMGSYNRFQLYNQQMFRPEMSLWDKGWRSTGETKRSTQVSYHLCWAVIFDFIQRRCFLACQSGTGRGWGILPTDAYRFGCRHWALNPELLSLGSNTIPTRLALPNWIYLRVIFVYLLFFVQRCKCMYKSRNVASFPFEL